VCSLTMDPEKRPLLHRESMENMPENKEIYRWASLRNTGQEHNTIALLQNDDSGVDEEHMQSLINFESLVPRSTSLLVTNIFMKGVCEHGSEGKTIVSSRRCLLDTGSNVNIITKDALQGLLYEVLPTSGYGHGVGGGVKVVAAVKLNWHLKNQCFSIRGQGADPLDRFAVVDSKVPQQFDCLLGWPWLQKHIALFSWICLEQKVSASRIWKKRSLRRTLSDCLLVRRNGAKPRPDTISCTEP
jgi:hypothetical protein